MSCPVIPLEKNTRKTSSKNSSRAAFAGSPSGSDSAIPRQFNELSGPPPIESESHVDKEAQPKPSVTESDKSFRLSSSSSKTPEDAFHSAVGVQHKNVYAGLRRECEKIEENIKEAEEKVLLKDKVAFLMRRHETEIANLAQAQAKELQSHKEQLEKVLSARAERKLAKKQARATIRATKRRDLLIQRQDIAAAVAMRNRELFVGKRVAFDLLMAHIEDTHEKQRKNLIASQERRLKYDKMLNELENRHLKEEIRANIAKKFHVRQTYQIAMNKRINEQLREFQLMELRHAKERFEVEIASFEELGPLKVKHATRIAEQNARHVEELHTEKEFLRTTHEANKLQKLQKQHQAELKKHSRENRIALRQMKVKHDQELAATGLNSTTSSKNTSQQGSVGGSKIGSREMSRQTSNSSIDSHTSTNKSSARGQSLGQQSAMHMIDGEEEEDGQNEEENKMSKTTSTNLVKLMKRHEEERATIQQVVQQELNDYELAQEARLQEVEERHHLEVQRMIDDQALELNEFKSAQEKEIIMEEAVHDTEMKAMLERTTLNSILDNIEDGVINIGKDGVILRFNRAAETIWGYTAEEAIGKNVTLLMPERYAKNHATYMNNYMTTGVRKIIGMPNGRRIEGKKKDGTEFPLQLSITELKTNDTHMFTGIARDLSEEVRQEEAIKAMEAEKKKDMEGLIKELDASKAKADSLLSQMLPPSVSEALMKGQQVQPQRYESATVFFLDIVGFTTICATIDPIETVALLNDIYLTFDTVIEQYDAYKVETIGDSYMIASGIPKKNGNRHAAEVATLALHIMSVVDSFEFKGHPEVKIQARIGIHSGPVVAGVIGSKMPRYCLFGDTVNTASRMESNSKPMKIQLSESTHQLLRQFGGFDLYQRGEIDVKGKGKMRTYFLHGKDGFAHPLPESLKRTDF
ncbi:adenylate and guanylate cyclase catalytic domain-containing protein [Gorgonomyces haynaldii]|nr:adenylate and guanylate cyclase catalytic domain-containing protein [Gorgonomyces haynaldii]